MDSQADEKIINDLLNSNDLKDIVKNLVKSESKSKRPNDSAINKLAELLNKTNISENSRSSKHKSTMPINDIKSDFSKFSDDEKSDRCKLASLFRLLDMEGWTRSIYSMISARFEDCQLTNPFGLLYHEITATSLVKVNEKGEIVNAGSTVLKLNNSNYQLHKAIYNNRTDVNCVVQISIPDLVAVSSMKCGLVKCSSEASHLYSLTPIQYHNPLSQTGSNDFSQLLSDLGTDARILFLRNCGVLVCGASIQQAWLLIKTLLAACHAQTRLIQLCGKDALTGGEYDEDMNMNFGMDIESEAELEFEARMRLLDNAGYRTGYKYSTTKKPVVRLSTPKKVTKEQEEILNYQSHVYMNAVSQQNGNAEYELQTENQVLSSEGDIPGQLHTANGDVINDAVEEKVDDNSESLDDVDQSKPAVDSEEEREFVKEMCEEIIDKSVEIVEQNPTDDHTG